MGIKRINYNFLENYLKYGNDCFVIPKADVEKVERQTYKIYGEPCHKDVFILKTISDSKSSSHYAIPCQLNNASKIYNEIFIKVPEKIFFNEKKKATTLIKGEKAVTVKCDTKDKFSKRIGFLEAYFQLTSGMSKTACAKYLDKIISDKNNEVGNGKKEKAVRSKNKS